MKRNDEIRPTPAALQGAELLGYREGDGAVLSALYRRYAPFVYHLLARGFAVPAARGMHNFRGVGTPSEQEDLAHEIFLRAFGERTRASYDGKRPFRDFLRGIARNTVIDLCFRRSEARVRAAGIAVDEASPAASVPGQMVQAPKVWERIESAELAALTARFEAQLGDTEREILAGRRAGMTQQEVADRVGLSRPTLRKRERDLRSSFLSYMQQHGFFAHHPTEQRVRRRRVA